MTDGTAGAAPENPPPHEPGLEPDGTGTEQTQRRRVLIAAAVMGIVVVGALLASVVWWGDDSAPAPAPAPTSVTTAPSSSTTTPSVDPKAALIGRVRPDIPVLTVQRDRPADLVEDPAETTRATSVRMSHPAYSPPDPTRRPLPRSDLQVEGRNSTDTGWIFSNPTPFNNQLTFLVTERHGAWTRVLLPVRPNGTEGWVRTDELILDPPTTLRVAINLGERKLRVFDGATQMLETGIVIGAGDSPTPLGRYFVADKVEKYAGSAYGPWVLPLNGYSETMDSFADGVPVIAMHGTNAPELIGQARSNGCIRMPDDVITRLKDTLPLGTPVDVAA